MAQYDLASWGCCFEIVLLGHIYREPIWDTTRLHSDLICFTDW